MLGVVAHAVGPTCVALAAALCFFTTWVPDVHYERDIVCVALLVAGAGAGLVHLRGASPRVRIAGALVMASGVAGALAVLSW